MTSRYPLPKQHDSSARRPTLRTTPARMPHQTRRQILQNYEFIHLGVAGLITMMVCLSAVAVASMVFLLRDRPPQTYAVNSELTDPSIIQAALGQPVNLQPDSRYSIPVRDSAFTVTGGARGAVTTYRVLSGETLFDVAEKFDINYCTLLWSNPPERISPLLPGTELTILPTDGILFIVTEPISIRDIAQEYAADPAEIIYSAYNHALLNDTPDTILQPGAAVMIPGAVGADCIPWERPAWLVNDEAGGSDRLKGCDYLNTFTGYPTAFPLLDDYRFVRGFTRNVHEGIDWAADFGTPVYAAGDGMVRYAGWHPAGYGNVIVVDHGGSYSIYGHLSGIHVNCGQPIQEHQLIGAVGSTGNSNADHLHFEVRDGAFHAIDPSIPLNNGR